MLSTGQFDIDVELIRKILNLCNNNIFQIEKFCGIILSEHRGASFEWIGGTFYSKDFVPYAQLLNYDFGVRLIA
jgi:hypothetical protein